MKTPVLDEVDQWLKTGPELRKRLIKEREEVAATLAEIDSRLASLLDIKETGRSEPPKPGGEGSGPNGAAVHPLVAADASAPTIVRTLLTRNPGLDAPQIILATREVRESITPELVHSVLHRLRKSGEVRVTGRKGRWKYRLQELSC